MAEEVEASVVAVAISAAVVVISVAVAISLGLPVVVLVAIALRNTEEGISSTVIVSDTIAISFLEVPFCMITPTMGMITRTTGMIIRTTGITIRTGTTDIRTIDRTTAFAVSLLQSGRRDLPSPARSTVHIEGVARRLHY